MKLIFVRSFRRINKGMRRLRVIGMMGTGARRMSRIQSISAQSDASSLAIQPIIGKKKNSSKVGMMQKVQIQDPTMPREAGDSWEGGRV